MAPKLAVNQPPENQLGLKAADKIPEDSLARLWERDERIRERVRLNEHGKLLRWPDPNKVGVISMAAIAANVQPLALLAQWWCPKLCRKQACKPSSNLLII